MSQSPKRSFVGIACLERGKRYRLWISDCCVAGHLTGIFLRYEDCDSECELPSYEEYATLVFDNGVLTTSHGVQFEEIG